MEAARGTLEAACKTLAEYGVGTFVATYESDRIAQSCTVGVMTFGLNGIEREGLISYISGYSEEEFDDAEE